MNKVFRKISVVIGFIILVGGIYLALQLGKVGAAKTEKTNTEAAGVATAKTNYVYTLNVANETLSSEVVISGKIIPRQKIDLYSEVTGTLEKAGKEFREGIAFRAKELMLTLDDTEAQLELQAAKSQLYSAIIGLLPDLENDYSDNFKAWKTYVDVFDIKKPIQVLPKAKNSREKLYVGGRNIENQYINIKRQEHRLTKYKIYAPFDGVLSNASTYEGALVRSGQKLGELTHPSRYELEAAVSLYDVQFFKKGNKVNLYSEATNENWSGTVNRFGKMIEEKTQTQKVFITINSSKLNEGMFLNGKITTKSIENVVALPRKLLINNNKVYIVENGKLALQQIEVVKIDNNQMYVRGLENGAKVLAQAVLGAYKGMPVEIIQ
ncbi:MAG: membrane fusion protein (multidrug efflux system) [Aureispira sp.]|jgi:membrane fusion protein (multidrug efflux system)